MRIYLILFFSIGILFQSQAQTKNSAPLPGSPGDGNTGTLEIVNEKEIFGKEKIPDSTFVYSYTQVMPAFPGGDTAFISFIKKYLIYPEDARQRNITGTVYVMFIIERDGSLSNIHIHRGLYPSCDKAAIDVISKSSCWSPGMNNGKPVRTQRIQRIRFPYL